MSDKPLEELKAQSAERAKDPKTRLILIIVLALWLVTLAALVGFAYKSYFDEKAVKLTLAQELSVACESGSLGPGFTSADEKRLCTSAKKVIENESIPGTTGPQGPPGQPGPQGPRGFTGPTGPRGFKGATGLPGLDGQNGSDGVDGADGIDGADGQDGVNGSNGTNGTNGLPGKNGQDGADGADGATGPQGPEGPAGPAGADGAQGPAGPAGPPGVVNVTTVGCDGPIVQSVSAAYDTATQTVIITCNGG